MGELNWTLSSFQDVVDYVAEMVGPEFIEIVHIANKIIENPSDYTGPQAMVAAKKLAAYRVKMGLVGSYYKIRTPDTKRPSDRLTKDAILTMYASLEEMINTLKLTARHDNDLAKG